MISAGNTTTDYLDTIYDAFLFRACVFQLESSKFWAPRSLAGLSVFFSLCEKPDWNLVLETRIARHSFIPKLHESYVAKIRNTEVVFSPLTLLLFSEAMSMYISHMLKVSPSRDSIQDPRQTLCAVPAMFSNEHFHHLYIRK